MRPLPTEIENNLQFSGHETFPLRQLWLRKAFDAVKGGVPAEKTVFSSEAAIAKFGVGKNMVSSIRHWALACGVIEESDGGYRSAPIGDLLFGEDGVDAYLERPATAWLVHWMLAGRVLRSTTWFWMFNHVTSQAFDRDLVFHGLAEIVRDRQYRLSENTLRRDVEVCLRCYVPRVAGETAEDLAEPLLGELGLIAATNKSNFEFRRGPKHTLPDGIFAYAVSDFWRRWELESQGSQSTLSFEAIAHEYSSPGRVFKLDENSVAERLMRIEDTTGGRLRWSDSAGVRQVSRSDDALRPERRLQFAKSSYAS